MRNFIYDTIELMSNGYYRTTCMKTASNLFFLLCVEREREREREREIA